MFNELHGNLDKEHIKLRLHAEIQRLSKWRVLNRCPLKGELQEHFHKYVRGSRAATEASHLSKHLSHETTGQLSARP